ncbi:hypothetical protein [Mycetocola saprophilus]|uniref:hypothetical protein n=1 Tax=Mycetocola saprophilus TaxID=76636 RepID=UPI003BF08775
MNTLLPRSARRASLFALAGVGLLLITGCAPSSSGTASPKPTASSSAKPSGTPNASGDPSANPSAAPSATADPLESGVVPLTCDQLLTPETVYAYNPNVSATTSAPAAGSTAAKIQGIGGLACQLTNNSSGTTIDVAVAALDPSELEDLKNKAAETSQQVPTYTTPPDEGYFGPILLKNDKRINEAQIFVGNYWLTLSSEEFTEPGALEQLSTPAIAALKAAKL